jgi:hypothetical protein
MMFSRYALILAVLLSTAESFGFDSNALTFTKIKYNNKTLRLETFNQDNIIIDQLFINL